ncbi:uncharacterized protein LOC125001109 [Mugil cephalus]|uniref:uncharacterized protein LOC125001109 n=1 Tax=Mugil cephalus TaxID=48193 RepID=UPI001FB71FA3|nr:uncharacterized protein LOC125001109 [Mugil cephalus]
MSHEGSTCLLAAQILTRHNRTGATVKLTQDSEHFTKPYKSNPVWTFGLKMVNNHHSLHSKMHCSASPQGHDDHSQLEATMPDEHSYFYYNIVFFFAEEVPLPERDSVACEVSPPPPSPPPVERLLRLGDTPEDKHLDLQSARFSSLDDEVAFYMSKPLHVTAREVPLPPSPLRPDDEVDVEQRDEKDLQNIGFPSLDDDDSDLMRVKLLRCVVALPPSPSS